VAAKDLGIKRKVFDSFAWRKSEGERERERERASARHCSAKEHEHMQVVTKPEK
jgi:hypothetical protein